MIWGILDTNIREFGGEHVRLFKIPFGTPILFFLRGYWEKLYPYVLANYLQTWSLDFLFLKSRHFSGNVV